MTTFLPYPSFSLSAMALDTQRLGNQRGEALAILESLMGQKVVLDGCHYTINERESRVERHPSAKMWSNNINALAIYGLAICDEWMSLGYQDKVSEKIRILIPGIQRNWVVKLPWWLGDDAFHASHRSNLLRKDEKFYRRLGWSEPTNLPYIYPNAEQPNPAISLAAAPY